MLRLFILGRFKSFPIALQILMAWLAPTDLWEGSLELEVPSAKAVLVHQEPRLHLPQVPGPSCHLDQGMAQEAAGPCLGASYGEESHQVELKI